MSLQQLAQTVQDQGRGPDTMLVHMAPSEVAGLQQLAQAYGGSLTVNPQTGLPEAGFLESLLPAIVGTVVGFATMNPYLGAAAGAAVGGATAEEGQDPWKQALLGALGGYGGSAMFGAAGAGAAGAAGAGSAATAGTGAASAALAPAATSATTIPMADAATYALMGDFSAPVAQSLAASAGTGVAPALTGVQSLIPQGAGYDVIWGPQQMLSPSEVDAALRAAELTSDIPIGSTADLTSREFLSSLSPAEADAIQSMYEGVGGPTQMLSPLETDAAIQSMYEGVGGATKEPGAWDKISSWWDKQSLNDKRNIVSTGLKLAMPEEEPVQLARGPSVPGAGYSPARVDLPSSGGGGFAPRWSSGKAEAPGTVRAAPVQQRQMAFAGQGGFGAFPGRGFAEGGLASLQSEAAIGDAGVVHLDDGGFVFSAPATAAVGGGSSGAGQRKLAEYGGIAINGPGDGQSDSIRALIGGQQPARVADGEVYFPPQAVAKIGGGDHQKGAKRLYEAMNRAAKMKWSTASAEDA